MPEIGQTVSHYRILQKIGQGGMGEVYLARDARLDRNVAVKFLAEDINKRDSVALERFLSEAKSAATLDHPHICVVHEAGEADGVPYIVMEYVEGESLKERLARDSLPLEEALEMATQIAEALGDSHSKKIIHRDLKPANVMLSRTGHVKVMDFGLAKRLLSSDQGATEEQTLSELTEMGTTVGTLAYMSPEQLQGQPIDHRSDIFSFGVVLYEMITRIHPFRKEVGMATAAAILNKDPDSLAQHAPELPERLVKLVSKMLNKDPAERPQTMHAIHENLKGILLEIQAPPAETGILNLSRLVRNLRRPRVAIPTAILLIGVIIFSVWYFDNRAEVRWAREEALLEIERMIEENDVWRNLVAPYRLAEQAEAIIPGHAKLEELFTKCSLKIDIKTEPPRANVYMKDYDDPDGEWTYLGESPIEQIRLPIGIFRWKLEKEGYETVLAAESTWEFDTRENTAIPYDLTRTLDKVGSIRSEMVRVQGGTTRFGKLTGDFFIDRYEVTNRQFKEFVDGGGYRQREYWKRPFVSDGQVLTWEEAMEKFVDQTSLPGPSTWQAGDCLEGQADHPVSGVSWYEAAAYAEYAGKSLPTVAHWALAHGSQTPLIRWPQLGGFAVLAPFTNFRGQGTVPVGTLPDLTAFGAYNMAGNVREWCWNETRQGRLLRGGAWSDNNYQFRRLGQAPPMDRSAGNGFRCALFPDPESIPAEVFQLARIREVQDLYSIPSVDDAIFAVYRDQFSYDQTDLNSQVESRVENPKGWIHEKISFNAAYGGERVTANFFLPTNTRPPYQAVIYFPSAAASWMRSSQRIESYYESTMFLSFLVKNGRAVLFPVFKGTFERGSPETREGRSRTGSYQHTEYLVQVIKDFRRSVDYLETRRDIDADKLAYYGMSWGGELGAVIPAVEDRLAASVLISGSLRSRGRPEVNPLNYVRRVTLPTLMLNGKFDNSFHTGIKPLFDLIGTPDEQKDLKAYDSDHIPPRNGYVKETLVWLDKYLGPVERN